MKEPHFVGKVAVKAAILHDGKVLLVRNHKNPDTWDFPGGRLHEGEDIEAGLAREIMEELGVPVRIGALLHSEQLVHTGDEAAHFFMTLRATLTDPAAPLAVPSEEIIEARWADKNEIATLKVYANCPNVLSHLW